MYKKHCNIHDPEKHLEIRDKLLKKKSRSFNKIFTEEKNKIYKDIDQNFRLKGGMGKYQTPAQSSREAKFKSKTLLYFSYSRCHLTKKKVKEYYLEEKRIKEEEEERIKKMQMQSLKIQETVKSGKFINKFRKSLLDLKLEASFMRNPRVGREKKIW